LSSVGIGTSTPDHPLEVEGSAASNHIDQRIKNLDSSGFSTLWFGSANNGIILGGSTSSLANLLVMNGTGSVELSFATSDTERMRIDTDGNIGIGTSTPDGILDIVTGATTSTQVHVGTAAQVGMNIGSTNDGQMLIAGGAQLVSGTWFARATGAAIFTSTNGNFQVLNNDSLTVGNSFSPTVRFTILPSGFVGIATTNPIAPLHVDQVSAVAAIPALILDQADISEGTINFVASARGTVNTAAANIQQSVRVELNGTIYRLALYVDA